MYFPDLSEYGYGLPEAATFKGVLNIGWLEKPHPFPKGILDANVIDKVKRILLKHGGINQYRGIHYCDFCETEMKFEQHVLSDERDEILMGSSELWLPSKSGVIYAAPSLIYHYLIEHHYQPPAEFTQAVLDFDLDSDWDGQAFADACRLPFIEAIQKARREQFLQEQQEYRKNQ